MKVLVISHTYISRIGREKWREMVRLHDVELRIIVPEIWKDYLFTIRYDEQRDDTLDILPQKIYLSGKEGAHFYASPTFLLPSFKPDILHVEEGADAFSFFQALVARRMFSPRTKSIFFTWMNWVKPLGFPFSMFERYNLAQADAAIAGNADAMQILRAKGFHKPVTVLPLLGIDPQIFSRRDERALKEEIGARGFVVGFIGRFVPEKGVLDLIDAAAHLHGDCTLLFLGGGILEQAMRQRARDRGIERNLVIIPPVPHADVPRYLNCMDVLVLPSYTVPHWKEQFGQVLVQAMACEVPVIGSSHAEIPRVIGDAGLVFEERNLDGLIRSLRLMQERGEMRADLARRGRARVLSQYTNTRIADRTYDFYRSLLS